MEMRKIKGNTLRSLITLLLLVIFLLPSGSVYAKSPTTRIDNNTVGMTRQEKKVYKKVNYPPPIEAGACKDNKPD